MPVRVFEIAGGRGLLLHCHGKMVGEDLVRVNGELLRDKEALGRRYFAVVDHTAATQIDYTGHSVKQVVAQDKEMSQVTRPGFLVAVVAPGNAEFGFSRMWQTMAEITGWEILVVRSRDEAERWLRLSVQRKYHLDVVPFGAELEPAD